jgi:Recombination endonuclease VII
VYQPVRDIQIACSRDCLLKCPSYIEAQRRTDSRPERRAAQNRRRNLATTSDVEKRRFINLRANMSRAGLRITWEMYQDWLARQDGFCKICGVPAGDKNGHVDHDHQTNMLRDLLCYSCNNGLGLFKDDPVLLRAAADYIEKHRALAAR